MASLILRQVGETAVEVNGGEGEGAWRVRVDVPGEGGKGSGPKPTELLALSLAACKAMAALQYALRKHAKLRGIVVEVGYETVQNPRRIGKLQVRFTGVKEQLDGEMLERVTAAMHACTIANTLHDPPEIETIVE
jgi:uncharacterized OsmC-like protein